MDVSRKAPITILISKNPLLPVEIEILPNIRTFAYSKFGPNSCFTTVVTTNNPIDNFDFAFYQNEPVVVLLDHYKEDNLSNSVDSLFTLKACNSSVFCVYKSKVSATLFQPKILFIISHRIEVFSVYNHHLLNFKHNIRILFITDKEFGKYYHFLLNSIPKDYSSLDFNTVILDTVPHISNPVRPPPYYITDVHNYSYSKYLKPILFFDYLNEQF